MVQETLGLCGVGSITFAVMHHGRSIFTDHVGYRDVCTKEEPDARTLHTLCSIAKSFVVVAFAILVDRGECKFTDPVGSYLPEFKAKGDILVSSEANFFDFFRHSGGLDNPVVTLLGPGGKVLVPEEDFINLLNDTPTGNHIAGTYYNRHWVYSNVAYGLVAMVIERISGKRYSDFVWEEILEPLNMLDTAVSRSHLAERKGNIAQPFVRLSDGTWCKQPEHEWTDERNTPVLAIIGIRSSVNDLMIWSAAFMDALNGGSEPMAVLSSIRRNPLSSKRVLSILNGPSWSRPNPDDPENRCSYHLSWLRCFMPSSMLHSLSWNYTLADNDVEDKDHINKNVLGRNSPPMLLHKMTGIGYCGTGSVNIFPETSSAIVVLSSGLNKGDPSDFVAAMLIQELFDLKPRIDILSMVSLEVEDCLRRWDRMVAEWTEHRNDAAPKCPLDDYVGGYYGMGITLTIRKSNQPEKLELLFNGREDVVQVLGHYNEDMYSYQPLDRDDWLRGAWLDWDYFMVGILHFRRNTKGRVSSAVWKWERGWSEPAIFKRIA